MVQGRKWRVKVMILMMWKTSTTSEHVKNQHTFDDRFHFIHNSFPPYARKGIKF